MVDPWRRSRQILRPHQRLNSSARPTAGIPGYSFGYPACPRHVRTIDIPDWPMCSLKIFGTQCELRADRRNSRQHRHAKEQSTSALVDNSPPRRRNTLRRWGRLRLPRTAQLRPRLALMTTDSLSYDRCGERASTPSIDFGYTPIVPRDQTSRCHVRAPISTRGTTRSASFSNSKNPALSTPNIRAIKLVGNI